MEKYIEDVKQHEKDVPDLLEAIMRPTYLVKEELRTNSCKSKGLQTRLKQTQNKCSILLRRPQARARALAKKDGKFKLAANK